MKKMDAPVSFNPELVDNGEEVVDHGKILWELWEKSRERQLARWSVPRAVKRNKKAKKYSEDSSLFKRENRYHWHWQSARFNPSSFRNKSCGKFR